MAISTTGGIDRSKLSDDELIAMYGIDPLADEKPKRRAPAEPMSPAMAEQQPPVEEMTEEELIAQYGVDPSSPEIQKEAEQNRSGTWLSEYVAPALSGIARRLTWPADVLKLMIMGESLGEGIENVGELEEIAKEQGIDFSREDYFRSILENTEFIPTQDMIMNLIEEGTGTKIKPVTKAGKRIEQGFELASFAPGTFLRRAERAIGKKLATGFGGVATTTALEELGAPEGVARVVGDVAALGANAVSEINQQQARLATQRERDLQRLAQEKNLPFLDMMTGEESRLARGQISKGRRDNLQNQLEGAVSEAVDNIIVDANEARRLRDAGVDLEALVKEQYTDARDLAAMDTQEYSAEPLVDAIQARLANLRGRAKSPGSATETEIKYLESIENDLLKPRNEGAINAKYNRQADKVEQAKPIIVGDEEIIMHNGQQMTKKQALEAIETARQAELEAPREAVTMNARQAVQQNQEWNQNVAAIYRKPEFAGGENAVREATAELNDVLRNVIEFYNPELAEQLRIANRLHGSVSSLEIAEDILSGALREGMISPKQFRNLMNSKKGKILERELGPQAFEQIQDISRYYEIAGRRLQKIGRDPQALGDFGKILPLIAPIPPGVKTGWGLAKILPYVRGYLMTQPATRIAYRDFLKEIAKGNLRAAKIHSDKIAKHIEDKYGSIDDFVSEKITFDD